VTAWRRSHTSFHSIFRARKGLVIEHRAPSPASGLLFRGGARDVLRRDTRPRPELALAAGISRGYWALQQSRSQGLQGTTVAMKWGNAACSAATSSTPPARMPEAEVSLVLPARNEAASVAEVIRRADAALERAGWSREIIVVDSASTDGTGDIALRVGLPVRVIREPRPGKGRALTTGFKHSAGAVLAFLDTDLDLAPEDLPLVIDPVMAGTTCAAAMKAGAALAQRPVLRRIGSRLVNLASGLAFQTGLRDHQTGLKAFRGSALREVLPQVREQGWLWDSEVLWRLARAGATFIQVPVTLSGCSHGQISCWSGQTTAAFEVCGLYLRMFQEDRGRRVVSTPPV
jgi:hypothetical protein